jgi:arginine repressor
MSAEPWVTMNEAANTLKKEGFKISSSKISRLAAINAIAVRESIVDRRVRYVNLGELRNLLQQERV